MLSLPGARANYKWRAFGAVVLALSSMPGKPAASPARAAQVGGQTPAR